jgi:hypothetical protein
VTTVTSKNPVRHAHHATRPSGSRSEVGTRLHTSAGPNELRVADITETPHQETHDLINPVQPTPPLLDDHRLEGCPAMPGRQGDIASGRVSGAVMKVPIPPIRRRLDAKNLWMVE